MSWLSLVPTWCWWLLALVLVGGGQQIRMLGLQGELDASAEGLEAAIRERDACRTSRDSMEALVGEQNDALGRLLSAEQERAAQARQAQQQAEGRALQAEQQAQAVLMERTPAGADACDAASQAFDDELRRERGL